MLRKFLAKKCQQKFKLQHIILTMQSDQKKSHPEQKSLAKKSFHFLWNIINLNEVDFKALFFQEVIYDPIL